MSIADEFSQQYLRIRHRDGASPEMIPVVLARTCASVFPVAAAGLSLFTANGIRVPIGASNPSAMLAERLQFTTGEGPCFEATRTEQPVIATEALMAHSWPLFHQQITEQTPYRAIVAMPFSHSPWPCGAVDLYFTDEEDINALDLSDARRVAELLTAWMASSVDEDGPAWLDSPATDERFGTILAVGMLNLALGASTEEALAVLRAHAFATGTTVDRIAEDVVRGRLPLRQLAYSSNA